MRAAIAVVGCLAAAFVLMLGAPASARPLQEGSYTLHVHVDGQGHVTSDPSGIDCPKDCTYSFDSFTNVTLTEKPEPGWEFVKWEGCTGPGDPDRVFAGASEQETCVVFMDDDHDVTATFRPKPTEQPPIKPKFPLTVTIVGVGSVSSDPAGIDCGLDCGESYTQGILVTLAPFQNATNFLSWSGDCTGSGLCNVTMDGPRAVTATFAARGNAPLQTEPLPEEGDTGKTGTPFDLDLDFLCYSEHDIFIANLYVDLLHRKADQSAFGLFGPKLDGGTPPSDIALLVLQSLEYRTMLVRGFYMMFLHREPSPEELVAGLAALVQEGMTTEQFMASLLGSEEYFQTRGGSTQDGFLSALYMDLLGRAPTSAERALFGAGDRGQIALQVLMSTEYRTKLINGFFQMFLGRAPTAAELNAFLALFAGGATEEEVAAAILGSSEYLGKGGQYDGTIDWGDGSTSPAKIIRVGDHCTVDGMHTYLNPGRYLIEIEIVAPDDTSTDLELRLLLGGGKVPPPGKENVVATGIVLIKVNGKFVRLKGFKQILFGTELDTTKGKVKLTSSDGSTAFFYEGRFIILGGFDTLPGNKKATKKVVVIRLTGGNFAGCSTRTTAGFSAKPKPKGKKSIRHVWGNAKGSFRTKGKFASATVRGTLWRTDDFCNGTLITVRRGVVDVYDLVLKKHFLIKAGHSYFAPK